MLAPFSPCHFVKMPFFCHVFNVPFFFYKGVNFSVLLYTHPTNVSLVFELFFFFNSQNRVSPNVVMWG